MHTLATIICYEVLENVECPSSSMKCCLEAPANGSSTLPPPQYTPAQRHPPASHSTRPTDSTPQSNPNKRIQVQLIINQFFLVFTQKKLHICITHKSMKFEREFQNERNNFYKKKVSNNFLVIQNVPLRTQPHLNPLATVMHSYSPCIKYEYLRNVRRSAKQCPESNFFKIKVAR